MFTTITVIYLLFTCQQDTVNYFDSYSVLSHYLQGILGTFIIYEELYAACFVSCIVPLDTFMPLIL